MPLISVFHFYRDKLPGIKFRTDAYFQDEFEILWDAPNILDLYLGPDLTFLLYPAYAELADSSLHLFDIWAS